MLDKRTAKLLSVLATICADGSFKIIEITDLLKAMLPRYNIDSAVLGQMIRFLADNEMIDVKYSDEKVYCLSVIPKGRVADEESRAKKRTGKNLSQSTLLILTGVCFVTSLLGAFLGAFLAGLLG